MGIKISRRNFFKLKPLEMAQLTRESEDDSSSDTPKRYFRPPGALPDEADYLSACERCHKCSEACPYGVIEHLGIVAGEAINTPYLQPDANPCRWCEDMPCIHACPSGALSFSAGEQVPPIGKVKLTRETCLTEQGVLCDACAYRCPPHIKAISMVERKPRLDEDLCVGCGMCAHFCESEPHSLSVSILDWAG